MDWGRDFNGTYNKLYNDAKEIPFNYFQQCLTCEDVKQVHNYLQEHSLMMTSDAMENASNYEITKIKGHPGQYELSYNWSYALFNFSYSNFISK